jgi:hypothetical protein
VFFIGAVSTMNSSPAKTTGWKIRLMIGVISMTGNNSTLFYNNTNLSVVSLTVVKAPFNLPHLIEYFIHSGIDIVIKFLVLRTEK